MRRRHRRNALRTGRERFVGSFQRFAAVAAVVVIVVEFEESAFFGTGSSAVVFGAALAHHSGQPLVVVGSDVRGLGRPELARQGIVARRVALEFRRRRYGGQR